MKITHMSYFWLDTWVMANVIQLATQDFCRRFLSRTHDPCGRQYDQMTQAARSGQANIAEGNSRHSTSRETEMKLTDVARASLAELAGDYVNWLLKNGKVPWSIHAEEHRKVSGTVLDKPDYQEDVQHASGIHILAQKRKFDAWLQSDDSEIVANCLLILCNRLIVMLNKQIEKQLAAFRQEGGFTEALTAERLASRTQQAREAEAPSCPQCGKPMIQRMARKGMNAGNAFWSCSTYPECNGTRSVK